MKPNKKLTKAQLKDFSLKVADVIKEYEKAGPLRRYDIMKLDLRRIENNFLHSFKPALVKGELNEE
jgi:hypothetical protein